MAGDATNLLGCLLTGQLPFQIAIATYFCCIDLCIMAQYYCECGRAIGKCLAENLSDACA